MSKAFYDSRTQKVKEEMWELYNEVHRHWKKIRDGERPEKYTESEWDMYLAMTKPNKPDADYANTY